MKPADLPSRMRPLTPVERGILWPVVYASIFDAPVQVTRLRDLVVGAPATDEEISQALSGPALGAFLSQEGGLISLKGHDVSEIFERRAASTRDLLIKNAPILSFVRGLPHVRFAALSGACAHESAEDGDIDVFVVTEEGALWRTLLWSTLVSKARGWRRVLCLNYLVDATAQSLPGRDFYGAFELISLKPLKGEDALAGLLEQNQWAQPMFPNFFRARLHGQNPGNKPLTASGGKLLEATARMIHRPYLRRRLPGSSGIELSDHVVRLHSTDHRDRLRGLFQDALKNIGVEAPPWI